MADPVLTTERLILRPPEAGDLPFVQAQMNTPAVMRFLGGTPRSEDEVAASFQVDLEAFASGDHRRWTVWSKDRDCRVGGCGLFRVYTEAAPDALKGEHEIGWTLAEPFWGRGYATEAAREVLVFDFGEQGLAHIYSQTSESNQPSTRMMQELGFTHLPQLGYVDPLYPPRDNPTTVWRLTGEEWEAL
ncbi:GNAT family N-acetyltransferase [Erythrobacter sp. SD-21]|uniref:GNAT family N-acetyltransferase n=1 Tax=Erythrobacter sp. SD-21 TaxID=161528 RepID=UPI000153F17F|nr:GNAT family N-acetyltransferase [Erythrobacter sp. SD-21]EDL49831.1 probable acetyltransferase [Erythrobacter sp. SD-21]